MRRTSTEIDIREEWDPTRIPTRCWLCGTHQSILVKMLDGIRPSKNRVGVCENVKCPRFIKVAQLETWVREKV